MKDIYEVFSGSTVEASFIKSILSDNNIEVIINNLIENSNNAGWVDPNSSAGVTVSVLAKDFEKSFFCSSQRTADIHNSILSQSTHLLACVQGLPSDDDKISDFMKLKKNGFDIDDLARYEFFYLWKIAGQKPKIVKV